MQTNIYAEKWNLGIASTYANKYLRCKIEFRE